MVFSWTPHRFAGGALALDVANSVILRFDALQSTDRFADAAQIDAFAAAASRLSAEGERFGVLDVVPVQDRALLISLREATDRYFRARVRDTHNDLVLADLLDATAAALRRDVGRKTLLGATAHSVLSLLAGSDQQRLRICGNCGWLFIDRSKNHSRIWCDMAVCGNRRKASRHYRRKTSGDAS
jgi:predicted RNA-binding Zn ribbon-like protein